MLEKYSHLDVLTPSEAKEVLRVSKNTMYRLLRAGIVPSIKIGTEYRIRKDSLIEYINQNERGARRF